MRSKGNGKNKRRRKMRGIEKRGNKRKSMEKKGRKRSRNEFQKVRKEILKSVEEINRKRGNRK